MKMMTIMPAPTRPEKCSDEAYRAIKSVGAITVPAVTAYEALRNSKGGYVIKPEAVAVEVKAGVSLKIAEMTNEELKTLILASGKRFQKKKMQRIELIQLAERVIEESVEIDDDEEVDTED